MTRLTIFRDVEFTPQGEPIVVTWHQVPQSVRAGDTLIQRYPLRVIEQLRDHALAALVTSGVRTGRTRAAPKLSVETKARRVWQDGMSVSQLERAAGISRSAAAKYARLLSAVDL